MHFLKPIRSNNGNVKYEILKYSRVFVLFSKKKANKPSKNAHFFQKKQSMQYIIHKEYKEWYYNILILFFRVKKIL